jgi:hypothetical protein
MRPSHWAAYAAGRLAPVLAAGLPPLFASDMCLYAFGDELAPRDGSVVILSAELCARALAVPSAPPRVDEVDLASLLESGVSALEDLLANQCVRRSDEPNNRRPEFQW